MEENYIHIDRPPASSQRNRLEDLLDSKLSYYAVKVKLENAIEEKRQGQRLDAFSSTQFDLNAPRNLCSQEGREKKARAVEDEPVSSVLNEAPSSHLSSFLHLPVRPKTRNTSQSAQHRVFHCKSLHYRLIAARRLAMIREAQRMQNAAFHGRGLRIVPTRLHTGAKRVPGAMPWDPNNFARPHRALPGVRYHITRQTGRPQAAIAANVATRSGFTPPAVPKPGVYNIMNNYNPYSLAPYLAFLRTLGPTDTKPQPEHMQYKLLQPSPHLREMNAWLLSLLPAHLPYALFRRMKQPEEDDFTVLARCIRYARSHAQQRLSWCVHPVHVALIVERTNCYGIEQAYECENGA